jgi:hypothetical protein
MSKQVFIVSDRAGEPRERTFRNVSSGGFSATVMSNSAYARASAKANTAIEKALQSPPAAKDQRKK